MHRIFMLIPFIHTLKYKFSIFIKSLFKSSELAEEYNYYVTNIARQLEKYVYGIEIYAKKGNDIGI